MRFLVDFRLLIFACFRSCFSVLLILARLWCTGDLAQLIFISWVAFVVPFRIGFDVEVSVESAPFWIDLFIDTFFIVDVLLNFRTAYMLPTGFLETRPRMIARNYMQGWLWIDCTASLPLTYVLDAVCFVYTCRRLIDLSVIAGT